MGKAVAMKRKRAPKNKTPRKTAKKGLSLTSREALDHFSQVSELTRKVEGLVKTLENDQDRIQDLEIHINLLTRLLTTLCVEKFGMRVGVLKRLIKRIEKEAIRDSQILHLESLYKLSLRPGKGTSGSRPGPKKRDDPWDEIS